MRKCAVCGLHYGFTHACSGVASRALAEDSGPPPALQFAPVHYLNEAVKIFSWDDAVIRRLSKDNNCFVYGFIFLAIGVAIPFGTKIGGSLQLGHSVLWSHMAIRYVETLAYTTVWTLIVVGLSHGLAKLFLEAQGTYLGVLRPFALGQLCRCLIIFRGEALVRIALTALLMVVFEEVDGIDRMKAFCLAAAIGVGLWAATYWYANSNLAPLPIN